MCVGDQCQNAEQAGQEPVDCPENCSADELQTWGHPVVLEDALRKYLHLLTFGADLPVILSVLICDWRLQSQCYKR